MRANITFHGINGTEPVDARNFPEHTPAFATVQLGEVEMYAETPEQLENLLERALDKVRGLIYPVELSEEDWPGDHLSWDDRDDDGEVLTLDFKPGE